MNLRNVPLVDGVLQSFDYSEPQLVIRAKLSDKPVFILVSVQITQDYFIIQNFCRNAYAWKRVGNIIEVQPKEIDIKAR